MTRFELWLQQGHCTIARELMPKIPICISWCLPFNNNDFHLTHPHRSRNKNIPLKQTQINTINQSSLSVTRTRLLSPKIAVFLSFCRQQQPLLIAWHTYQLYLKSYGTKKRVQPYPTVVNHDFGVAFNWFTLFVLCLYESRKQARSVLPQVFLNRWSPLPYEAFRTKVSKL